MKAKFAEIYQQARQAADGGNFERALQLYDEALGIDRNHAEAFYKRGNALKSLGRLEAAIASYDGAIERRQSYAYAYCNRGTAQQALGFTLDALSSYDQAIALEPSDALSHYNRALLMQELCKWEEALAGYQRALALDPQFADARFNCAITQLFCGQFNDGWLNYEWRWKNAQRLGIGLHRDFKEPLWLGDREVAGKRLLLHSEGGLGDTLQFCRYAQLTADLGATVYLEVQAPLQKLLSRLPGVSMVLGKGEALPAFDLHCPLMSLPLAFKTSLETIPAMTHSLRVDRANKERWQALVADSGRPKVGLAWSGNQKNLIDERRSIRLSEWIPYLPKEFEYYCLQRDVREQDEATLLLNPYIRRFDLGEDMTENAALCECMDLIVSVDTSVAHLSGALGLTTWILLPHVPDWRWLRDRIDTPWYPSARLYRQESGGGWLGVFERVAKDLRNQLTVHSS